MLDKSIPFKSLYMKISASDIQKIKVDPLPEGFSYQMYQPGDEAFWAKIETSVGEFLNDKVALVYFKEAFSNEIKKLEERMVFIANNKGEKVATAIAYYEILPDNKTSFFLHWVAVNPKYQGLGLGKAVVKKAMTIFKELNPGEDVMLHTQTWSHKAIQLYHKIGFHLTEKEGFYSYSFVGDKQVVKAPHNEFLTGGKEVLEKVIPPKTFSDMMERVR